MIESVSLSERQWSILRFELAPFADRIERVAVFGSRALGRAKPASDIDIAIYGTLDEAAMARLWSRFDQSSLAVTVDLVHYDNLTSGPMKRHIDRYAIPIFTGAELTAERPI